MKRPSPPPIRLARLTSSQAAPPSVERYILYKARVETSVHFTETSTLLLLDGFAPTVYPETGGDNKGAGVVAQAVLEKAEAPAPLPITPSARIW